MTAPGRLLSPEEAIAWLKERLPAGVPITRRSLDSERAKGNLVATKLLGRVLFAEADLEAMLKACRAPVPRRASSPPPMATESGGGRASDGASVAAVREIARALIANSRPGSSPRRREAPVIPLRSGSRT